eukprot:CAMPEP_0194266820 /NCGR_PEP_ID=MMETSP0169-20130528/1595_1 /TAXON_ID=218684 /ORGANISM="Corethron pennatum, Strain L29A3" /LENGTH=172 /DNA_ID=CAMNT_0039007587 /DNA_START=154 /DNA_END=673 /DNA_ORIENTATION=-
MKPSSKKLFCATLLLAVFFSDVSAFAPSFLGPSRTTTFLLMSEEEAPEKKPVTLQEFIFSSPKAQEVIRLFMSKGEAGMKVAVANDPEVAQLVQDLKVILQNSKWGAEMCTGSARVVRRDGGRGTERRLERRLRRRSWTRCEKGVAAQTRGIGECTLEKRVHSREAACPRKD